MREHGLSGPWPRRFRKTTDSDHGDAIADDLVMRDFAPAAPNTVWAWAITYMRTWAGLHPVSSIIQIAGVNARAMRTDRPSRHEDSDTA